MSETTLYQFVHLLTTVFWIGGMTFMHFVLNPALAAISPPEGGRLMGIVAKRFTIIAWSSILLISITGLFKTPSGFLYETSTTYGQILLLKHIAFFIMIISGAVITFVVAPKLRSLAPKSGERPVEGFLAAQKWLGRLSGMNMVLGILVLFLVSMV